MDETGGSFGVWGTIGAGLAAVIGGALAWLTGRQRRQAEDYGYQTDAARYQAEHDIILKLREEVERLADRIGRLEADGQRMRMRIWHLEDEMRKHSIPIPPERPMPPEAAA